MDLLAVLETIEEEETQNEDLEMLALTMGALVVLNTIRRRSKLTRSALNSPRRSAWNKLYWYADDSSFLNITGFDREAFHKIVEIVAESRAQQRTGRPPLLDVAAQVGILLLFVGSQMEEKFLCLLFGIVPSTVSVYLAKLLWEVPALLEQNKHAKIQFPKRNKMYQLAALVQRREPEIHNVIGFVDGLAIPVRCSEDEKMQSANYSGYHHDTMINNVFAFSAEGMIIFACLNFPGSWHDGQVCVSLVNHAQCHLGDFAMCVDQAFPRKGLMTGKFVGPLSRRTRRRLSDIVKENLMRLHSRYVSLRQGSEWGMRGLQGTFARLRVRLSEDQNKRYQLLYCIALLHNFRTYYVGLNQIATVFNYHYEQFTNFDGYDRIARYFS